MKKIKRIYHTWDKWECYPAGFYENKRSDLEDETAKKMYADFLSDSKKFESGIKKVFKEWRNSCEHYLTNEQMNRIAWIGQAAACASIGLPSIYRSGYFLLSKQKQQKADLLALKYLNKWLKKHDFEKVNLEGAGVKTKVNLY